MLKELLLSNRSYRRFDESYEIPRKAFAKMAEAIRLTSSAGNLQRIRVLFVGGKEERGKIFETLGFAAYLKDWNGPKGVCFGRWSFIVRVVCSAAGYKSK